MDKVSVILVIYNSGKYLQASIESVLKQDYHNIELIILDDGSTDNTKEILNKYSNNDSITIHFNRHTGNVGRLRNEAIKISKGEKIAFIDGDDIWESNKITEQIKFMSDYGLVCSNGITINEMGEVISALYFQNLTSDMDVTMPGLINNNCILTSSVLINKSIVEKAGYFDESVGIRGEDYILWLNSRKITKIKFIAKPLIRYRRHSSNLSYLSSEERKKLLFRTIEIREQFLNDADILNSNAASKGLLPLYAELTKQFFNERIYSKAAIYSRKMLAHYPKMLSLKYVKYTLIYMFSAFKNYFSHGEQKLKS